MEMNEKEKSASYVINIVNQEGIETKELENEKKKITILPILTFGYGKKVKKK